MMTYIVSNLPEKYQTIVEILEENYIKNTTL